MRYLGDKVVDVLMYIIISSVIASLPYLLTPTLSPALVFLSVAVAAAIGMILVVLLAPYVKQAMPKEATHPKFYASRDELNEKCSLKDFLRSAKYEIHLLGFSLETISTQNRDTIKQLLKDGKSIKFLVFRPDPDSKLIGDVETALGSASIAKALSRSLDELCRMKQELVWTERERLEIKTYGLIPIHNIVAIDPASDEGVIRVENYQYDTASRSWVTIEISKRNHRDLFEKYWNSYRFVYEKSNRYGCPNEHLGLGRRIVRRRNY